MRGWMREVLDDLAAGSYIVWVYLNPYDGRMYYY